MPNKAAGAPPKESRAEVVTRLAHAGQGEEVAPAGRLDVVHQRLARSPCQPVTATNCLTTFCRLAVVTAARPQQRVGDGRAGDVRVGDAVLETATPRPHGHREPVG